MTKPTQPFHEQAADRHVRTFHTFLRHISAENMGRLFASLVAPDRMLTSAQKRIAEYVMDDASE